MRSCSWKEISESFLPEWTDQQLRLRTCRLLGTQSLARYMGWKGNAQVRQRGMQRRRGCS